jgi:ATP-dependent helicase HrpB
MEPLPIDAALPALLAALRGPGVAVLVAPPGAGKTTRVPLALLPEVAGRILMLEPRRLAARAAAERMAESLGEPTGQTVGWRIRGAARVGPATRIEVVTEGILTRMLQADPALAGVGAVILDEFHERSLHADLALALTWEARGALRPDLRLVVMSATLDAEPLAALLGGAPVVRAEGRVFPVETRWLDRPAGERPFEAAMADLILRALAETAGGVLAFLPGEAEIRATAARLAGRLPDGVALMTLSGAMELASQRRAVLPLPGARKLVLATAIAETSLTLAGIGTVVDGGRARRSRFDPGAGMARLVTERVTRAEAEQRRGRAGREGPGVCYRLWTRGEEGGLADLPPPEIAIGDLAGLALELALWGAGAGEGLAFLTPPNPGRLAEARALLAALGALDGVGRITAHGRAMAEIPLHPRLAHMLLTAGRQAAPLAALLSERDPLPGAGADLGRRLAALAEGAAQPAGARAEALGRIRAEARRLARIVPEGPRPMPPGAMAALAFPDRVGMRREGAAPRWLLSGGRGAAMDPGDPMAGLAMIVACDLDGDPREARIRLALPLTEADLRAVHGARIGWSDLCEWSRREGRVVARSEERFGALVLAVRPRPDAPPVARAAAAADGVRALGLSALGWSREATALRARAAFLRAAGAADLPDLSDPALMDGLDSWLAPFLGGCRTAADLANLDPLPALRAHLGAAALARIDRLAPAEFVTPLGRRLPIDYTGDAPTVSVRVQELFGLDTHPTAAGRPLRLALTSPAGRPVAVTTDLPGFWRGAWAEVRRDLRGRYPKHPWPEDPRAAAPTLAARPRGG